jgi:hypothetical protein
MPIKEALKRAFIENDHVLQTGMPTTLSRDYLLAKRFLLSINIDRGVNSTTG